VLTSERRSSHYAPSRKVHIHRGVDWTDIPLWAFKRGGGIPIEFNLSSRPTSIPSSRQGAAQPTSCPANQAPRPEVPWMALTNWHGCLGGVHHALAIPSPPGATMRSPIPSPSRRPPRARPSHPYRGDHRALAHSIPTRRSPRARPFHPHQAITTRSPIPSPPGRSPRARPLPCIAPLPGKKA